jgi:tetratricopeptide (TPR) repeat protein
MPVQVYEDSLELLINVLQEDGYTKASWPHNAKSANETKETQKFHAVILENDYLKLTILPELAGRLWEITDKRIQSDTFGGGSEVFLGTPAKTGVDIRRGLLVSTPGSHHPNSLVRADFLVVEPEDPEQSTTVIISQFGSPSVTTRYSLLPGDARVRVEVVIHNRTPKPVPYESNTVWIENDHYNVVYNPDSIFAGTFCLNFELGTFEKANAGVWKEDLQSQRRAPGAVLAPGQSDSYSFYLTTVNGVGDVSMCNEYGVGLLYVPRKPVDEDSKEPPDRPAFSFRASRIILGAKLLIQNDSGATFEMPVDLYPEKVHYSDLTSIPWKVVAAELRDSSGATLARILPPKDNSEPVNESLPTSPIAQTSVRDLSDAQLLNLTSDFTLRVSAYLELAARATERGDYQRADTCYEHALLFNGDDPLAWWAKSVNRRIGNLDDENAERTELLNAHYLSPLEPCLRAEAFLAQPRNHGKDPSPLLASFNDIPENFIEVACQLIQARFYEEAAYFIDEALRHQNLGMLHYLHAYLLSRKGGMEMEVASRVQMATKAKFPPMPYRDLEREILTLISEGHELPQILRDWLDGDFD